jgi:phosphate transport system permease protein
VSARTQAPPPHPPEGDGVAETTIQKPPSGDRIYRTVVTGFALVIPLLLIAIAFELVTTSWSALTTFGLSFFTNSTWDPVRGEFGIAPAIVGTLITSFIALLLATPLALGVAVFLSEFAPAWLRQPVAFLVDLLAAIPSVVYGLWGFVVMIPFLRSYVIPFLSVNLGLGATPFFAGTTQGQSILAASVILAIMVLPYISAVSREILLAVPRSQREAALALGATKWEMIRGAVLPFARTGILGGVILGLARALGETMAVALLIGNAPVISASVLAPGYTLAAQIANKFTEATTEIEYSSLMAAGLTLFAITLVVNGIARALVWRVSRGGAI